MLLPDGPFHPRARSRGPVLPLLVALVSCGSPPSPRTGDDPPDHDARARTAGGTTAPAAIDSVTLAGLAELDSPPPLPPSRLAALEGDLRERVDTSALPSTPAVGDAGWEIVPASPTLPEIDHGSVPPLIFGQEPEPGATGQRVRAHPRLYRRVPAAKMATDGTVELRFETVRPIPAAAVYYGTLVPEDPFGLARHRKKSTQLESKDDGRSHVLRFDPRVLLRAKYDVANMRERGYGIIAWRLEALDPEHGTSRVFDGELPFRCAEAPCTKESRFIQRPSARLGPFVDQVEPEQAIVSFDTDATTAAEVVIVDEEGREQNYAAETPSTHHEIRLTGLTPGSRYRYYALFVDARGEVGSTRGATFETPSEEPRPFSFIALSDSRSGHGPADDQYAGTNARILRGLLFESMKHDPALVMFVGDLVDGYTTEPGSYRFELEAWQRVVQPIGAHVPIYEVMGNHEALIELWDVGWAIDRPGEESAEAIFRDHVVNPTNAPASEPGKAPPYDETVYSFDHQNAHFVSLNSNYWFRSHPDREDHPRIEYGIREGVITDAQLEWLDQDLAAARENGADHLFVFTHEPAFPNGGHVHDGMWWHGKVPSVLERRARFLRILAKHGVSLLVHGDEHNYSRTKIDASLIEGLERPVWQLISGGAGAPFYAQDRSVPWVDNVARFDARQHFIAVHVNGPEARVIVRSVTGETIDTFEVKPATE